MQQGISLTRVRRSGVLALVAGACAAALPAGAQPIEYYEQAELSADGSVASQQRVPVGDRRATRPPTTIVIPDGSAPAPTRPMPQAAPAAEPAWDAVPPPELNPTARWNASTRTVRPAPPPEAVARPEAVFDIPDPQVLGGPRARRSAATMQERRSRATASLPAPRPSTNRAPLTPYGVGSSRPSPRTSANTAPAERPAPQRLVVPEPVSRPQAAVAQPQLPTAPPAASDASRGPAALGTGLPAVPLAGGRDGLGPGDSIRVTVFGQPDLETETVVGEDGSISLPLINRVRVGGLSPQAAGERIAAAYEAGDFLKDPQVSVILEALKSRQISVLGAVKNPGRFPLDARLSTLDALALAGGVTDAGSLDVVLLRPSGGQTLRYDLDVSSLLSGRGPGVELAPGDTVYVPEAPKFYIYGEVQRPNAYPIREGELTVMQAISLGGGLTDRGSDSRIQIRRESADGRVETLSADLRDLVQPDDVIYVKERLF